MVRMSQCSFKCAALISASFLLSHCSSSELAATVAGIYRPKNLPTNFGLRLPKSLTSGLGSGGAATRTLKRNGRASVAPKTNLDAGGTVAQGFSTLREVVDLMLSQKEQVATQFLMADQIFDQVIAQCGGQTADCTIPAGRLSVQVDDEMTNFIQDSMGGEEALSAEQLAELDAIRESQLPVPEVVYRDLAGAGGLKHSMTFNFEGDSVRIQWDEAKTKASVYYEFGDAEYGSGNSSFSYDLTEQIMTFRNSATFYGNTFTHAATLQGDPTKEALNGIKYSVSTQTSGSDGASTLSIKGVADDRGGYAESTMSYSLTTMTVSDPSHNIVVGQDYVIVPQSAGCVGFQPMDITGSVFNAGSGPEVRYWGSPSTPVSVCSYDFDESYTMTNGQVVANVTLSAGTKETFSWFYSETFSQDGEVVKAGYKDAAEDPYLYYLDTTGADAAEYAQYEDYYSEERESGELIESAQITIDNLTSAQATEVILMRDGKTPSAEDWSEVIGQGWYDTGSASYSFYFWGSAAEMTAADVYSSTYNYQTGDYEFTRLNSAVVRFVQ